MKFLDKIKQQIKIKKLINKTHKEGLSLVNFVDNSNYPSYKIEKSKGDENSYNISLFYYLLNKEELKMWSKATESERNKIIKLSNGRCIKFSDELEKIKDK